MYTLSKIIELMNKNNIGNQELASALGLNRQLITDWKAGRSKSYKKYLVEIADYFGVSVDYLLGKTNAPTPEREVNIKEKALPGLTREEQEHISEYRELDSDGKALVNTVTKHELDRIARQKGLIPSTVAARSADGSETNQTEYLPDLSQIPADETDI